MNKLSIPVSKIKVDPEIQPRVGGLDDTHVKALEESHEDWPALSVVEEDGDYLCRTPASS